MLICFPYIIFFIFGKYEKAYVNDNRKLQEKPMLVNDGIEDYIVKYEKYVDDHAPFRSTFISTKSKIEFLLFGISPTEMVTIGRNDILFFEGSMSNYKNYTVYTEEELEEVKEAVLKTQAFFDENGIDFYIFIPPNKALIYDYLVPNYENKQYEQPPNVQVVNYLKENTNVKIIYPVEEMHKFAEENPDLELFYLYDTHWNNMGAYVGGLELFKAMGIEKLSVEDIGYEVVDATYKDYDLARMMGLNDILNEDIDYIIEPQGENVVYLSDKHTINDSGNGLKVMMNRDSFTIALLPYLANEFTEVNAESGFHREDIIREKPDIYFGND